MTIVYVFMAFNEIKNRGITLTMLTELFFEKKLLIARIYFLINLLRV